MTRSDPPQDSSRTLEQASEAVASPRLELTVEREGGTESRRSVILDGDFFRIGSQPSNELVLADPLVSRFHCRLVREDTRWRVIDMGSRNGTRLAGVTVRDADLPAAESVLELGASCVRIRELPAGESVRVVSRPSFGELYGHSVAMRKLFGMLERVAHSDANVLIEGESGTGKELVATEIVRRGPRAKGPLVVLDCGAISPNLVESTLFGHARGAFTGADRDRVGAFEAASGGTVFLDEIGELPLDMQPKLLRALEAREIQRVGETRARRIDVRVVAATNRRLEQEINSGRFREDLYFRLSVVTLRVPPLRARPEDLDILIPAILERMGRLDAQHLFTKAVLDSLRHHDWPGNVRELRNYVERTVVLQDARLRPPPVEDPGPGGAVVAGAAWPPKIDIEVPFRVAKEAVVSAFEQGYVNAVLDWSGGNVSRASRKAGLDRMSLHRILGRYGLRARRD